jgi:hypothetical protein
MAGILDREPNSLSALNSKASGPLPRADTGSVPLDRPSDTFTFLLHLERRFDPFVHPAFDAVLREPIARLTTALINLQRPNEGLKIAGEKPLPDEEAYLDSIISTFEKQMRNLWKPGGFEREGNTKAHGIVRGQFIVHRPSVFHNFSLLYCVHGSRRIRGFFWGGSTGELSSVA